MLEKMNPKSISIMQRSLNIIKQIQFVDRILVFHWDKLDNLRKLDLPFST